MLFFPNAKINIGLNVINKRFDGYHNIETFFYPIGLSDVLEFVPLQDASPGNIHYTATGISIEGPNENNLCVKAYHLLHHDFKLPAIAIHLHKIIPPGAGLGGGSSDAAFMLSYLNLQFELKLTTEQLCDYASELGSDCAFFIMNKPLFGYERGNKFKDTSLTLGDLDIVLINPGIHVSTAEAYSTLKPQKPAQPLEALISLPVKQWKDKIVNDFEGTVIKKHPAIGEIKDKLYAMGAVYASMSGSGSSVYGLFTKKAPAPENYFPEYFCWSGPIQIQSRRYP
jgi:4-diphosphocytidyl-2-C-methyl-D-erythritol kinase